MKRPSDLSAHRRRFLRLLLASPLLPWMSLRPPPAAAQEALESLGGRHDQDPDGLPAAVLQSLRDYEEHLSSAKDAITVFDLEAAARRKLHVGHLAYLTAVEDQAVLRVNREGFNHYQLRPRRLTGISAVETSITLLGQKWGTPLILCPAGHQGAFDPEGEVAVARAARTRKHIQTLSASASRSIEEVTEARGSPVWSQFSWGNDWNKSRAVIKRAEAVGAPVLVFTVDEGRGTRREVLAKVRRRNIDFCKGCHTLGGTEELSNLSRGVFRDDNYPMALTPPLGPPMPEGSPTWDSLKRLKDTTRMKVVVKGIVTREDAELAVEHGADGVWVSNHGGNQDNTGRSTVECLPEVLAGVARRAPVIVDGGFRRGGDIFKALALGATAVGVARPYLWGLAAFGQEGVEAALDILDSELKLVMMQMGTASVAQIAPSCVMGTPRGGER